MIDLDVWRLMTVTVTDSWYMGANVPGKVREQLIYLAGVDVYAKEIKDALQDWKGFNLIR
jgi:hypothetical protein